MQKQQSSLISAAQLEQNAAMHRDVCLMMLPLLAMAVYLYGLRPALLCLVAVATANLCDRVVAVVRRRPYQKDEMSSEAFALLMAMMMPASVSYRVLITAVLVAVLVGKEAFGGYGSYPFHPAAVGYAVAAVSWPDQLFRYPQPFSPLPLGGIGETVLVDSSDHALRAGGVPAVSDLNLVLGNYAGAMGVTAALVILACSLYLLAQKRMTLTAPLCFLGAAALVAFCFPRLGNIPLSAPWQYVGDRLNLLKYEMLSGSMLYTAVFLVSEPVTLPKTGRGRAAYGLLLGVFTMMFRYYGSYETGVCFALLAVNSLSGWLDRVVQRPAKKPAEPDTEGGPAV